MAHEFRDSNLSELLFLWAMKQGSVIDAIIDLSDEYYSRYHVRPDELFVNIGLYNKLVQEIGERHKRYQLADLPVPLHLIIWYHCTHEQSVLMPHAEFLIVANSTKPGVSCTL